MIVGAAAGIAVWAWSPWEDNGSDTEAVAAEAREADLAAAEMEGSCPGNATCEISVVGRAQPRIWLLKYDYQPNDSTVAAGHTCLLLRLDDYPPRIQ